jgi:hypothetical protein
MTFITDMDAVISHRTAVRYRVYYMVRELLAGATVIGEG